MVLVLTILMVPAVVAVDGMGVGQGMEPVEGEAH